MKAHWIAFKKRNWDGRDVRERRMLGFAALILLPLLAWSLLWQPAHVATAKLRAEVPAMRAQAAHLRAQAEEAAALHHSALPAVLDARALKTAVEESATRHGMHDALSTLDAQEPNAVRVTLASVAYTQWLDWSRTLQREQHLRVDSANIVALPQTGMVKINATLSNGGAQ
ncbi:MAG: type II secretion system protein M [Nitrosomonadales bacterium]|nr:type II secretion system protein M [Nitrosomonadales bacterium]